MKKYRTQNGWTRKLMLRQIFAYNNGTRASNTPEGSCLYQDKTGNRCAMGAFLPASGACLDHVFGAASLLEKFPELKSTMPLPTNGMVAMQLVHDHCENDTRQALATWIINKVEDSP